MKLNYRQQSVGSGIFNELDSVFEPLVAIHKNLV